MRSLFAILSAVVISLTSCSSPSESKITASVVKLYSSHGSCSGTQIKAPSGKSYILTAAHCIGLVEDGTITASTESGGIAYSKVLAEDDKSDLLLLEAAPGIPAITSAKDVYRGEFVRTFTHGAGLPTYKTSGVIIGEDIAEFPWKELSTPEDHAACNKDKNRIRTTSFFGMDFDICTVRTVDTVTTANIVPGSSGGLMVNSSGEMVGVASASSDNGLSYFVTLKDIQRFLSDR